ncbi:MAG: patatin-like phospholipase family protein [Gammaproteobacteria bacterium]|nr:patatin-like phospholipase family protein [Gammaproteobacteria bacterium]
MGCQLVTVSAKSRLAILLLALGLHLWVATPVDAQAFGESGGGTLEAATLAEVPDSSAVATTGPRLGLVLAGGGARGAAHIGVLKVLEEMGLRPDVIAGTSMGAIVGGLYATGMTAADLEQIIDGMDWDRAFSDDPDRPGRTMRRKTLDRDLLVKRRLGFNRGGLQVPIGVLQGQQLDQVLKRILRDHITVTDFDRLQIPFRAVATDLATGEPVILGSGSLVEAIRASMSVPGVFTPVVRDERMLVDGGVAMNVPVEVAQAMGADVLIVVDLSSPLFDREELDSVLRVTQQLTNLLTRRNSEISLARMGSADILVRPELGDISVMDFPRAAEAVALGERAARESIPALRTLAASLGARRAAARVAQTQAQGVVLEFVDVDNRSGLNDAIVSSRITLQPGDVLDLDELERNLDAIYALDVFDVVRYDLVIDEVRGTGLVVTADQRKWGPNYLQFGIALESDFDAINEFTLGMAYTRNAINQLGGEVRVRASIGQLAGAEFDLYQPLEPSASWFVQPTVAYDIRRRDLFENMRPVGTVELRTASARLAVGRNFDNRLQLRAELERATDSASLLRGPTQPAPDSERIAMFGLAGVYDSLNNVNFPDHGVLGEFRLARAFPGLGGESRWETLELAGTGAVSLERWSLLARGRLGLSWGDPLPLSREYRAGGFGALAGLPPGAISGPQSAVGGIALYRRIGDLRFLPLYAGLSFEGGNVWAERGDMAVDDLLFSAGAFLGLDTILGPVYLAWGRNDRGQGSFYFYLGNPFELRRR